MVTLASRASWGARHRDGDGRGTNPATEVFIHHTVTATLAPNASVALEQHQMRLLEQIGQDRFARGISYHAVIFPSGRGYQGASFVQRGTQVGGRNTASRGIAFAGNFERYATTNAMIATAGALVAHGRGRWWTPGAPVRGHNAASATACPGRHVLARMAEIRNPAPAPPPPPPPPPPPEEDDMRDFLTALYLFRLGRLPDVAGYATHMRRVAREERTWRQVDDELAGSPEGRNFAALPAAEQARRRQASGWSAQ